MWFRCRSRGRRCSRCGMWLGRGRRGGSCGRHSQCKRQRENRDYTEKPMLHGISSCAISFVKQGPLQDPAAMQGNVGCIEAQASFPARQAGMWHAACLDVTTQFHAAIQSVRLLFLSNQRQVRPLKALRGETASYAAFRMPAAATFFVPGAAHGVGPGAFSVTWRRRARSRSSAGE